MKTNIPTPCSKNWNNPSYLENSKICQAYPKEVIDFNTITSLETLNNLKQNNEGYSDNISLDQIDAFNAVLYNLERSSFKSWSITESLVGILENPHFTAFDPPAPLQSEVLSSTNNKISSNETQDLKHTALQLKDSITINGKVTNKLNNLPILGAIIEVNDTNIRTTSDEEGNFILIIPKSTKKITLTCFSIAYEIISQEVLPKNSISKLKFELEEAIKITKELIQFNY